MTWQKGRQLATYTSGGTTAAYIYDMTGQRGRKTVGSSVHDLVSEGSSVVADQLRKLTITQQTGERPGSPAVRLLLRVFENNVTFCRSEGINKQKGMFQDRLKLWIQRCAPIQNT